MIRVGRQLSPPHLPRAARGFSWWYADVCGQNESVVLVWARGLPFVPLQAGRDRAAELSVALAFYRDGREHFYALRCEPPEASVERPGELRIGRSVFRVSEQHGRVQLRADLDLELPAMGALRGVVELAGPLTAMSPRDASGPLEWTPIALGASGRAALAWDGGGACFEGRAYLDGNAGDQPLPALGIRDWRWGRVALPEREVVYFVIEPEDTAEPSAPLVLSVDAQGRASSAAHPQAVFRDGLPGWFGLRRAQQLQLAAGELGQLTIDFVDQLEDGPFYQRYAIEARSSFGETGRGIAERVVPARIDQAWHRPLVNMRVDRAGSPRSAWLPLLSGASQGRLRRLLGSWLGARPRGTEAWR